MTDPTHSPQLSRRTLLAGATAATAATAGCVGRVLGGEHGTQLSLDITTLPADIDPFGVRIANHLRANLDAVGIDSTLTLTDGRNLSESVLVDHDFDIYVGQLPYTRPSDPDVLYPLFRSTFDSEVGWQNPFGFTHLGCDDLLDSQRTTTGETRASVVDDLQALLARTQPCSPLVAPDLLTAVRTDTFEADSWNEDAPTRPHNLLKLSPTGDEPETLGLAVVNDDINANRNPISASYRQEDSLVDLLYDSLAVETDGEYIPWTAREYEWDERDGQPTVSVRLRDGLQFHDGEPLSAYDVGFTYEFLRDTALGSATRPVPSERFRGQVSLVEDIQIENSRSLRITFTETSRTVAERALTVPILPAHIWRGRTDLDRSIGGGGRTTVALRTANTEAIGSGPIQFEDEDDDVVEFSRFEDHFLWRSLDPQEESNGSASGNETSSAETENSEPTSTEDDSGTIDEPIAAGPFEPPPEGYGEPPFERVVVEAVGSDNSAVELLTAGEVDATAARLRPSITEEIESDSELALIEHRSNGFYHLGFNTRRQPLRNPNVRRLIAQLVDKSVIVEDHFDGHGVAVTSLLAETEWVSDSLRWTDTTDADPEVPFLGTAGEVDVETARERFRAIGYEFTEDNELIR